MHSPQHAHRNAAGDSSLEAADDLYAGLDRASRRVWALFADWCAAADLPALPADSVTVAMFLAEHPAAAGTQRRRVGVINAAHRQVDLPQPGRSELVRDLLDAGRTARRERAAAAIANRIPQLPLTGSPGLFGRRDALLLVLATTLRFEQIARLRRDQVSAHADTLLIHLDGEEPHRIHLPITGVVAVYQRWLEVLGFLDSYPSTSMLAQWMDRGTDLTAHAAAARRDERPLLTPIDRWGHTPYLATALTGQSVAALVRAHLTGHAPTHERVRRQPQPPREVRAPIAVEEIVLDDGYYERGIRARADAHIAMSGVTDVLGDVEGRADRLLADLLAILEPD
ncbi:hypothetical protein WSS_A25870 [Rhodococcus opacus M213]|uniref:Recombinase n=1 Tax=Rhodococcus opacus M213 TaxID=1129896 RepID=K8XRN4_RHOOP|nr:hypothetical protein [Rhodococcus opacus]EKT79715.1 hypothetical protein WSS_A25870 [Rhodococcus opacus M213]